MTFAFRPMTRGDLDTINALTKRSVAHWGYEQAFLDWDPESITVYPDDLGTDTCVTIERDGGIVGHYVLRGTPDALVLDKLFLDPAVIGVGLGRIAWNHAVATARELGATGWTLLGDPNASGFYTAMGAVWQREQPTAWPGWNLQVFHYDFPA
jgi:predicted N-acetyltransferase YhbS